MHYAVLLRSKSHAIECNPCQDLNTPSDNISREGDGPKNMGHGVLDLGCVEEKGTQLSTNSKDKLSTWL